MNVAIVNSHFKLGGIRQSLINLLYALKDRDIIIDLFFLEGDIDDIRRQTSDMGIRKISVIEQMNAYYNRIQAQKDFRSKVRKVGYGLSSRIYGRLKTIKRIIESVDIPSEKYDVVISYSNGIWTHGEKGFVGGCDFFALRLNAKCRLAWIHSNPKNLGITEEIGAELYSQFDKIVNVSYGCKDIFDGICPALINKSVVIYNLCGSDRIREKMMESQPYEVGFHIVTVARLDNKSKRLDNLAKCCHMLKEAGRSFKWHVVGDGNDLPLLKSLIQEYDIADVLVIEGRKNNPYPYMKNASVYVCTSAYEAFPLVIRESFICGTPIITTPIPPAREIIEVGKTGTICKGFEPKDIFDEVVNVMSNPSMLQEMSTYIAEHRSEYEDSVEPFMNLLEDSLNDKLS